MTLKNLLKLLSDHGCSKVYVKTLSPNDNSKNQVYLGGSFEILNVLPISEILVDPAGDWKKERFKAKIIFSWILDDGTITPAPKSQLILYPKYPEVRFSGFLLKCENAPSELMTQRLAGRLLFFGVTKFGSVLGFVCLPDSELAVEFRATSGLEENGIFKVLELTSAGSSKELLLAELLRIHNLDWIKSKRLDKTGAVLDCLSPNCGGYTLEAELGITPNGYSEPDYLGWEVKQFGVTNFSRIGSSVITLMTPEPTHGFYVDNGATEFIRRYGYDDKVGRADRMNFGGIHKSGLIHPTTKLKLSLLGFDAASGKIRNSDGKIALVDEAGNEAASWSFASMLIHWNRKHNQACYVPSLSEIQTSGDRSYKYGNNIILGSGTDFQLFLRQMDQGNIYYDPGIKLENMSTKPTVKKRSQFRIKSGHLPNLYHRNEIVDVSGTI